MSAPKHTPGPWHAHFPSWVPWPGSVAVGSDLGDDICWTTTAPDLDSAANARLIAAAPDMLAALQATDALWSKDAALGFAEEMKLGSPVGNVWALIRAAISKATDAVGDPSNDATPQTVA